MGLEVAAVRINGMLRRPNERIEGRRLFGQGELPSPAVEARYDAIQVELPNDLQMVFAHIRDVATRGTDLIESVLGFLRLSPIDVQR